MNDVLHGLDFFNQLSTPSLLSNAQSSDQRPGHQDAVQSAPSSFAVVVLQGVFGVDVLAAAAVAGGGGGGYESAAAAVTASAGAAHELRTTGRVRRVLLLG